jgi:hypothetical protein
VARLSDDEGCDGFSAEAGDHVGLAIVHCLVGGEFLEVALREDWSGEGFDGDGFAGLGA